MQVPRPNSIRFTASLSALLWLATAARPPVKQPVRLYGLFLIRCARGPRYNVSGNDGYLTDAKRFCGAKARVVASIPPTNAPADAVERL